MNKLTYNDMKLISVIVFIQMTQKTKWHKRIAVGSIKWKQWHLALINALMTNSWEFLSYEEIIKQS